MTNLNDMSAYPSSIVLDNLSLVEVVKMRAVSTAQRDAVDKYLTTLLRTGRLEEHGNAYTELGQYAGAPIWRVISLANAESDGAKARIATPVIADLVRAIGEDDVRRV